MAKLKATELEQLKGLGITKAKTEEEARATLIKNLAKHDVEDLEDESLKDLIEMYDSFYDADEAEEEVASTPAEEEDYDELAEEVKPAAAEEEEEEEEEAPKPKAKAKKKPAPVEEEEEEEETPKPKAKAKKEATKKDVPAAEEEEEEEEEKPKAKAKAKPKTKRVKMSTIFPKENEEHEKLLKALTKRFKGHDVKLLSQGITIFAKLESARKAIISFDRCRLKEDGTIVGDLFFNSLKGKEEVEKHLDVETVDRELKFFNDNLLFISKITIEQVFELLDADSLEDEESSVLDIMMAKLEVVDKRMSSNRKKLEDKLKGEEKPKAKANKKKPAVEEEEEEEE